MDSEMVIEVPDTPDRAFTRSVAESSSRIRGIDDNPSSSSNGYLEPITRTYSRHNKNSGSHGLNGNGVTSVDDDFFFTQARIARVISEIPDARRTHSSNVSPIFEQSCVVIDNGTNPNTIDLSRRGFIGYRRSGNKEEKHLSSQRERNSISGFGKLHVRSSKEKSKAGNSSKDLVSFSSTNEIDNLKCHSKDKMTVQQLSSRAENEQFESKDSEFGSPQRDARQKKLPNGFIPFCDLVSSSGSSNDGQADCYHQEHDNSVDKGASLSLDVKNDGIEIGDGSSNVSQSIAKRAELRRQELVNPKNRWHRKLVRNGCISPNNIAKIKNDAKALEIDEGNAISSKISNSNSSQSVQCYSSKCRIFDKSKGKEVMKDEFVPGSQNVVDLSPYRRSCLMPQKEPTIISDMDSDTNRIQIDGSEASHKHMGGSSLLPSSGATCIISESENMSGHLPRFKSKMSKGGIKYAISDGVKPEETTSQSRQHIARVQGCLKPDSDAPHLTGKRKMNSTQSNAGECSSSTVDSMRISRDRTSLKTSDQRSTRCRKSVRFDTGLAPIVEIDESDTNTQEENHEVSDESIARSMQLESDEVLARQLQEQFYLESPSVGTMEREAYLPAFLGRLGRPRFSHSSTRLTARIRTDNRTGRMGRNMSRLNMSVEERLDFLEAIEATLEYDNGLNTPSQLLDVRRDFNENDYEMLLALDENNHHVGASESQINNLPQSLFQQSTDSEEACTICLEMPSFGEAMRHLPCLHKFHKDCIDPWLRRKRSCPICKSGIT